MTYATKNYVYEKYAFSLPGNEPTLLNIRIEQAKDTLTEQTHYAQLIAELLEGIEIL